MNAHIQALDNALAAYGEDITLRRVAGTGTSAVNVDVKCRAMVSALSAEQLLAQITATDLNVIISPTQIDDAKWPGGTKVPNAPPYNEDPRIPVVNSTDSVIVRGRLRKITFVDPKIVDGELVRINMRVAG